MAFGILGNMRIVNIFCPPCDAISLESKLSFHIKPFFYQNVKTKMWISQERKELLTWNKKHFSSILKSFQLSKIATDPRVKIWVLVQLRKPYVDSYKPLLYPYLSLFTFKTSFLEKFLYSTFCGFCCQSGKKYFPNASCIRTTWS